MTAPSWWVGLRGEAFRAECARRQDMMRESRFGKYGNLTTGQSGPSSIDVARARRLQAQAAEPGREVPAYAWQEAFER